MSHEKKKLNNKRREKRRELADKRNKFCSCKNGDDNSSDFMWVYQQEMWVKKLMR